jgi:hypothetical protein
MPSRTLDAAGFQTLHAGRQGIAMDRIAPLLLLR